MTESGIITTFYSFKGGTGRTMALANVAWILASLGRRVLAVDWDLEAPGLHRYFLPFLSDPELRNSAGLLETIEDYVRVVQQSEDDWPVGMTNPLDLADPQRHAMALMYTFPDSGCLHFLGAGRQDVAYPRRLHAFDWSRFYEAFDGATFIDQFGKRARENYEIILIDSRTGVADTSGICTLQLPDQVVLCFTYNRQSVEGVAAVASALAQQDRPYRNVLPVPMRVITDGKDIDEARDFARRHLDTVVKAYPRENITSFWENAEVGHNAEYGFAEKLASFYESPGNRRGLLADMLWLTQQVVGDYALTETKPIDADTRELVRRRFRLRDPIRARLQTLMEGDPTSSTLADFRELLAVAVKERTGEQELTAEIATGAVRLARDAAAQGNSSVATALLEESTTLLRKLAVARPDAYYPDLALSLNNLGNSLSDLGRREAALAATEEAVAVYRELVAVRPNTFKPDLAMALNNLSASLSDLGRRENALAATEEAVAVYRELAAARPDAYKPDFAATLNKLGNRLSDLGRREAALVFTEEAVAVYRELAAARPDAFKPDLADALNNLGAWLGDLGRREAALAVTEEAVAVYRELAAARPDAFKPDLAGSLNNLGAWLGDLGRREAALAATEEAVAVYRELVAAAARPDTFKPAFAGSLSNLGIRLSAFGRREAALAATEEAVAILRELAAARPEDFKPTLASALRNLSIRLGDLDRWEGALASSEEAVAIYRELAAVMPDAFQLNLAISLATHANCLEAVERLHEAFGSNGEAIKILRPPFLNQPLTTVRWMKPMCVQYRERAKKLGIMPDTKLLAPIEAVFAELNI